MVLIGIVKFSFDSAESTDSSTKNLVEGKFRAQNENLVKVG